MELRKRKSANTPWYRDIGGEVLNEQQIAAQYRYLTRGFRGTCKVNQVPIENYRANVAPMFLRNFHHH